VGVLAVYPLLVLLFALFLFLLVPSFDFIANAAHFIEAAFWAVPY
jgi:Ca2+/Na+ antiporter